MVKQKQEGLKLDINQGINAGMSFFESMILFSKWSLITLLFVSVGAFWLIISLEFPEYFSVGVLMVKVLRGVLYIWIFSWVFLLVLDYVRKKLFQQKLMVIKENIRKNEKTNKRGRPKKRTRKTNSTGKK